MTSSGGYMPSNNLILVAHDLCYKKMWVYKNPTDGEGFHFVAHHLQGELLGSLDFRRPSSCVRACVSPCVRQQFVNTLEDTVLAQSSSNLLQMFILTKSSPSLILGHMGSESRSLGQILEKAYEHPRSHICGPNVP